MANKLGAFAGSSKMSKKMTLHLVGWALVAFLCISKTCWSTALSSNGLADNQKNVGIQEVGGVNGIVALRSVLPVSAGTVFLNFHTKENDGGYGFFRGITGAEPGSYVDNNGTIVVPKDGDGSEAWLRMFSGAIDIRWFGAKVDGIADDSDSIAAAILANPSGEVEIYGTPKVSSSINLDDFGGTLTFRNRSRLLAGKNNLTVFQSTTHAWGVKIIDSYIDCNGFGNVTAFDLSRFQAYGSVIERPSILNCSNGIILRTLNWGTRIDAPYIMGTARPIVIMDGNSVVQINHPRIDTFGSVGIDIQRAKTYPNVGVQILSGYIQNGGIGIRDASYNTQVVGTYFERCTAADISLVSGSSYFYGAATSHTSIGAVAYKGRQADSARIIHPFMSSGGRKIGLFDFDKTNLNCRADFELGSGGKNLPLGIMDGLQKSSFDGHISSGAGVVTQ